MRRIYSNNAVHTELTSPVGASDDELPLASVDGWPVPGADEVAIGSLDFGEQSDVEVFSYTGLDGTTLTGVVRGLDGTAAQARTAGTPVVHVASAGDMVRLWSGELVKVGGEPPADKSLLWVDEEEDAIPVTTDHNNLSGLANGDPHPQYLNKTGSGVLEGSLRVLGNHTVEDGVLRLLRSSIGNVELMRAETELAIEWRWLLRNSSFPGAPSLSLWDHRNNAYLLDFHPANSAHGAQVLSPGVDDFTHLGVPSRRWKSIAYMSRIEGAIGTTAASFDVDFDAASLLNVGRSGAFTISSWLNVPSSTAIRKVFTIRVGSAVTSITWPTGTRFDGGGGSAVALQGETWYECVAFAGLVFVRRIMANVS